MANLITSKGVRQRDAGEVADLLCPRCGADNLHHLTVTVFDRGEDASSLVRTKFGAGNASMSVVGASAENPSSRRGGLTIQFECEQCGGGAPDDVIELTIARNFKLRHYRRAATLAKPTNPR